MHRNCINSKEENIQLNVKLNIKCMCITLNIEYTNIYARVYKWKCKEVRAKKVRSGGYFNSKINLFIYIYR